MKMYAEMAKRAKKDDFTSLLDKYGQELATNKDGELIINEP